MASKLKWKGNRASQTYRVEFGPLMFKVLGVVGPHTYWKWTVEKYPPSWFTSVVPPVRFGAESVWGASPRLKDAKQDAEDAARKLWPKEMEQ